MTQPNGATTVQIDLGAGGRAGDITIGDVAGRDRFTTFINIAAASFEQARGDRPLVPIEPDGDDRGLRDDRVAPLAQTARARRLVVVHGRPDMPVEGLLRRVAAEVAEAAARQAAPPPGIAEPYPTLALLDASCDRDELKAIMDGEKRPVVIIAEGATRRLAGWNLDELCALAAQHGHYLLLASSTPQATWNLSPSEKLYWRTVDDDQLYDPAYLEALLLVELKRVEAAIDPAVASWIEAQRASLAGTLRTPLQVRIFARALRDLRPAAPGEAQAIARDIAGLSMRAALNRWFHAQLDRRGQLIAFGLCFFDGLWEETVYEHLGRLLGGVWGQGGAATLDRVDLDELSGFFAFTRIRPPRSAISARYAGQRRLIFAEALPQLRRHARQALYELAEVLRASVSRGSSATPAGSSWAERDELRRAISAGFMDLGPIDRQLLDEPLLLLAADGRPGLRERVGEILARWYAGDAADRNHFFETVRVWRQEPQSRAFVGGLFAGGQVEGAADPADCIDAALLVACAYAARGERGGALAPYLQRLLAELAASPGPRATEALRAIVIPQLVPMHLDQLSGWLYGLTRLDALRPVIVERLTAAVSLSQPEDDRVATVIERWRSDARTAPAYQPNTPLGPADGALIAAAELHNALSRAPSLPHRATLGGVRALSAMRAAPRHPAVRRAIESAVLRAGVRSSALWDDLFDTMGDADAARYIELLRELHLEERGLLRQGDAQMQLNGRSYWVTLNADPPPTASKLFIEHALAYGPGSQAHALALRAELALAQDFDTHERAFVAQQLAARPAPAPAAPAPAAPAATAPLSAAAPPQRQFYRDIFLPIYVTRDAPHLRPQIETLLPIAAQLPAANSPALDFLLQRSWSSGQLSTTRELAPLLREAVELNQLGPLGVSPLDYPRAARPLTQALREAGVLPLVIILAVLSLALLVFLLVVLINALFNPII